MIKKQKSCVKRIHLVTDDYSYDRKAFCEVKILATLALNLVTGITLIKRASKLVSTIDPIISQFGFHQLINEPHIYCKILSWVLT